MKNMKRIGWVGYSGNKFSKWLRPTRKKVLVIWGKAVPCYIDPKDLRGKKGGR